MREWPFSHLYFFCAQPFGQTLVSTLIYFFYLYMTIRPKLGITLILKFIIFLIEPIFCLQYCLYILSTTIIPLYFVYYIHRSAALIFCMLYPWLYEVLALELIIIISLIGLGRTCYHWEIQKKHFFGKYTYNSRQNRLLYSCPIWNNFISKANTKPC